MRTLIPAVLVLLLTGCAAAGPCAGEARLRFVPYGENWQARMECQDHENDAARIVGRH